MCRAKTEAGLFEHSVLSNSSRVSHFFALFQDVSRAPEGLTVGSVLQVRDIMQHLNTFYRLPVHFCNSTCNFINLINALTDRTAAAFMQLSNFFFEHLFLSHHIRSVPRLIKLQTSRLRQGHTTLRREQLRWGLYLF